MERNLNNRIEKIEAKLLSSSGLSKEKIKKLLNVIDESEVYLISTFKGSDTQLVELINYLNEKYKVEVDQYQLTQKDKIETDLISSYPLLKLEEMLRGDENANNLWSDFFEEVDRKLEILMK